MWCAFKAVDDVDLRCGPTLLDARRVPMRKVRKGLSSLISVRTIDPDLNMSMTVYRTNGDIAYVANLVHLTVGQLAARSGRCYFYKAFESN